MAKWQRTLAWGEALELAVDKRLKPRVTHIARVAGKEFGSRNTYGKLYKVKDPADLVDEGDRIRAWLLLASIGEDPAEWGIPASVLPLGFHPANLRQMLASEALENSRVCFTEDSDGAPIILDMSPYVRALQSV